MFVVKHRKIFYTFSIITVVMALAGVFYFGFNVGIDFKGGAIIEVSYPSGRPAQNTVSSSLNSLSLGAYSLRPSGDKSYILRTRELTETEKTSILEKLSLDSTYPLEASRFNSIGPTVGKELTRKAYIAIVVVLLGILLFVTFAFRKVSEPVPSWKYGLATIIALAHDVVIPTGFFVIISHFYGGEVDLLFVTALLAILGYSVHDTIVVFDRVREHLRVNKEMRAKEDFETTVDKSVTETFGRSINTSLTIFLVLVALYFVGSASTKDFVLVLLIGIIAGTYSSIFLASPLLVTLEKFQSRGK